MTRFSGLNNVPEGIPTISQLVNRSKARLALFAWIQERRIGRALNHLETTACIQALETGKKAGIPVNQNRHNRAVDITQDLTNTARRCAAGHVEQYRVIFKHGNSSTIRHYCAIALSWKWGDILAWLDQYPELIK